MMGSLFTCWYGELLHCEKLVNALEYKSILQNGLLPTTEIFFYLRRNDQTFFTFHCKDNQEETSNY